MIQTLIYMTYVQLQKRQESKGISYHLGHAHKLIIKFKLMLKITISIKINN